MAQTTSPVPHPKNQGGHAAAPTQTNKVQKKQPASLSPGQSPIEYGYHTPGHGGSAKSINNVKKG